MACGVRAASGAADSRTAGRSRYPHTRRIRRRLWHRWPTRRRYFDVDRESGSPGVRVRPTSCRGPHRRESPTHPRKRSRPWSAWCGAQLRDTSHATSVQSHRDHTGTPAARASAAAGLAVPAVPQLRPGSTVSQIAARSVRAQSGMSTSQSRTRIARILPIDPAKHLPFLPRDQSSWTAGRVACRECVESVPTPTRSTAIVRMVSSVP